MPSVKELNAQLSMMRMNWQMNPPDTAQETYRRQCQEKMILVQREAEEFRNAFRSSFLMTKAERFLKEVDNENVVVVETIHKWEAVRDRFMNMLSQREKQWITHYTEEIKKSHQSEIETSETQ